MTLVLDTALALSFEFIANLIQQFVQALAESALRTSSRGIVTALGGGRIAVIHGRDGKSGGGQRMDCDVERFSR